VAAAHTGGAELVTSTAAAIQQQQQQQQEAQLQRLATLKEEVLALKAALAVPDAGITSSSTAASDASGRDQGAAAQSPLASPILAGNLAGNCPAGNFAGGASSTPHSPLQKQSSGIQQRSPLLQQTSDSPALPTESAAVAALTHVGASASEGSAQSAGDKVAVLLQELRAALAEQEAAKVRRSRGLINSYCISYCIISWLLLESSGSSTATAYCWQLKRCTPACRPVVAAINDQHLVTNSNKVNLLLL
jgi:hypothetical protein